jgi:hypothetical protein
MTDEFVIGRLSFVISKVSGVWGVGCRVWGMVFLLPQPPQLPQLPQLSSPCLLASRSY